MICTKPGVKGVKNKVKSARLRFCLLLAKWCYNQNVYQYMRNKMGFDNKDNDDQDKRGSGTTVTSRRRGNQCAFQLMNFLFSDE